MANKYLKMCSTPLAISEMQIKTLVEIWSPVRMNVPGKQMTADAGEGVRRGSVLWEGL